MSRLQELCKELRLGNLEKLACEIEYKDSKQYLTDILELVVRNRRNKRIECLIKRAGFPNTKTLDGYSFTPITFPRSMSKEDLLSLEFLETRNNILMLGAVGTGKTHLAIALGVKACLMGKQVKFYRTVELTQKLLEKQQEGKAGRFIQDIGKADLLILDEVGYVPFSKSAAQMLFSVISNSYEQQSIIMTSNLELGQWNQIFGDDRMTAALIDRLVHYAHILAFSGTSFRFKKAMERCGKQQKE